MNKNKQSQFIAENLRRREAQDPRPRELKAIPLSRRDSIELARARLSLTKISEQAQDKLLSTEACADFPAYTANIENYIGAVSVPLGLAGPLRIRGSHAHGDYYIPLATTEAALVASYNRGLKLIREAAGCQSLLLNHSVQRSPCFKFTSLILASQFCVWVDEQFTVLKSIAETVTAHGKLTHIQYNLESNFVVLNFNFSTGKASGQNMVTLATEAAYQYIVQHCPIAIQAHALESNASGDKKLFLPSMLSVRGYKVTAELSIQRSMFEKEFGLSAEKYLEYFRMTQEASILTLNLNHHAHFANALAAMFIALGQDVACVAEAATGISKVAFLDAEHIYISITMPNLIVGTIGGGTQLPHAKACFELLDLRCQDNSSAELAEIIAGVCLAGEISLSAAVAKGNFANAHRVLARSRKKALAETS